MHDPNVVQENLTTGGRAHGNSLSTNEEAEVGSVRTVGKCFSAKYAKAVPKVKDQYSRE